MAIQAETNVAFLFCLFLKKPQEKQQMRPISAIMKNVKSSNFNSAIENYLPGQE